MSQPKRTLTKKQATDRVLRYINDWAAFLGLHGDWAIRVELTPEVPERTASGDDSAANATWSRNYRAAKLKFEEKLLRSCSDADAEWYALHELGHLWYAPVSDLIAQYVGDESIVAKALADAEETLIDKWVIALLRARRDARLTE